MASINALLKRFESTIAEVSVMESTLANLIADSHPLNNIISTSDRFAAITNDIMDACKARNFKEESILIAIKNMLSHKEDYPMIEKEDWEMLSKIKIVR